MTVESAQHVTAYGLAIAFAIGALVHVIGPSPLRKAYAGWGYPAGFHYVTAVVHASTAALLFWPSGRPIGVVSGIAVTLAALATLVRHREWKKTPGSFALIAALLFVVLAQA